MSGDLGYIAEGLRGLAVPMGEVHEDPVNARKGHAVDRIAASLKTYGQRKPIVANRAQGGKIEAGNGTYRAAKSLGWSHLAVVWVEDDAATAAGYGIADNRLGDLSEWDVDVLADVVGSLDDMFTGFTVAELDELLPDRKEQPDDPGPQVDKAEELRVKWGVETGQLWALGEHRLICGDCTDRAVVARVMGGEKADLVWTDPPYGVGYVGKTRDALTIGNDTRDGLVALIHASIFVAAEVLKPGASFYVAAPPGPQLFDFAVAIRSSGLTWRQSLVWVKNTMVLGHSDYHYSHEVIFYGSKGPRSIFQGGRKQVSVFGNDSQEGIRKLADDQWQLQIGNDVYMVSGQNVTVKAVYLDTFFISKPQRSEFHPTMKPVELVEKMVANSSKQGEIVYEPFSGSGTTLIACERLGRRCRAAEILPGYVAVALERWSVMTGRTPEVLA